MQFVISVGLMGCIHSDLCKYLNDKPFLRKYIICQFHVKLGITNCAAPCALLQAHISLVSAASYAGVEISRLVLVGCLSALRINS